MPWISKTGRYYLVPAGALDDDPEGRPQRNIYWDSRADWYSGVSSLPTFAEGPDQG